MGPINSKITGDGVFGGGGGSRTQILYDSITAICLTKFADRLLLKVVKNVNGDPGTKNMSEAIDVIAEMLCALKFQGGNEMFQKSLKLRLAEVMTEVLLKDDCIPTKEAIKEYMEGGG